MIIVRDFSFRFYHFSKFKHVRLEPFLHNILIDSLSIKLSLAMKEDILWNRFDLNKSERIILDN